MSSLKYDSHSVCTHCRETVCSLDSRCSEYKDWSLEVMQEYLKHKKSLATKRGKKPAVAAASVSHPAVESSPLLGSPPSFPSISEDSKIRDAVLAVLQSFSRSGSVDINPSSFTAPCTVPDYAPPVVGDTGGDGSKKPHNVGSLTRTSGVGALDNPAVATTHPVHHDIYSMYPSSARPAQALGSSGVDQLRVPGSGPLDSASSSLSPNSLLFPLPPSTVAVSSSIADIPPPASFPFSTASLSSAHLSSSYASSSISSFLPPLPSFAPSSLSSASFPSSCSVNSALPHSVSSLFPSSSSFLFPSGSSSSSFVLGSFLFLCAFFSSSSSWFSSFLFLCFSASSFFWCSLLLFPFLLLRSPGLLFHILLSLLLLLPLPLLSRGHCPLSLWWTTRRGCWVFRLLTSCWLVGSWVRGVRILRVLCALPSLIFFLILCVISPLALPFS